jgi:pilus assembly protein Flp/PilA
VSRRITRQRTARDRGSSAVEFALMVAAMAAMILAVVLGVGRVVGDVFFHGCREFSSEMAAGGECVAPGAPDTPAAGAGTNAKTSQAPVVPADSGQDVDGGQSAPGVNDLGTSDDM